MSKDIFIRGNKFIMGADQNEKGHPLDREFPKVEVEIDSFYIEETTVTNADFKKFIKDTGYITDAEKLKGSFVFHLLLRKTEKEKADIVNNTPWWYYVETANWKQPEGQGSSIKNKMDHPVVHISRNDAIEYCNWAGKRLPTEAEWEYAARGGTKTPFPWGNQLTINDEYYSNTWQGEFPISNTVEDGYLSTAPAKMYPPNQFGLYQVIGNVWEWCLNPGRINIDQFNDKSSLDFYNEYWLESNKFFAVKGGSFLCHSSYCNRYRLGARNQLAANTTSSNLGFRCVSL